MAKLQNVKVIDMAGGEVTKIAYEGAEYERVEDDAEVGDLVTFSDDYYSIALGTKKVSAGEFYAMCRKNYFTNRVGESSGTKSIVAKGAGGPITFRKVSAPSLEDRVTALEGEVETMKGGGNDDAQGYRKVGRSIRVGDYVKAIRTDDCDIEVGKFYEVTGISTLGNPQFVDSFGDKNVLTSDEEYEVYEKVTKKPIKTTYLRVNRTPQLKVGDYAKVITEEPEKLRKGDIVKVTKKNAWAFDFRCYLLDDSEDELFHAEDLTPATDEEVAKAKAEAEEKAKQAAKRAKLFTDAGRKVDEYRAGDIVEVVKKGSSQHSNGDVGVISYAGSEMVKVNTPKCSSVNALNLRGVKPIVFVENRLDRN